MPRRRKPPGFERWTWAEINAGRRMSKSEKRWNRLASDLNWERRSDGTYQAPPNAVPFLVIIVVLMIVLGVLAPHGVQNVKGDIGPVAILVFAMLSGTMILLVAFGRNEPYARSHSGSESSSSLTGTGTFTTSQASRARAPAEPVVRPALAALGRGLSFRWIARLPDWLQPIVWSSVITSPAVAIVLRWRLQATLAGDVAFCLWFVVVGCALGGLVHDGQVARRRRKAEEEAERAELRERFRRTLARELSGRPKSDFDYEALVAEHAMPRFEADAAAAMVYRRFSDRVVEDGVITAEERARLATLARLLQIGPDRVAVIEAAAKSDRFRAAVDEALADGVVTDREEYELEQIRISLGIADADWEKGRDRINTAASDRSDIEGITRHG